MIRKVISIINQEVDGYAASMELYIHAGTRLEMKFTANDNHLVATSTRFTNDAMTSQRFHGGVLCATFLALQILTTTMISQSVNAGEILVTLLTSEQPFQVTG